MRGTTIIPQYLYSTDRILSIKERSWKIGRDFVQNVRKKPKWEQILFIHDTLCRNLIYAESGHDTHTIVGPFSNKWAVCEGMAKAAKFLFDFVDIESCLVTGKARSDLYNNIMEDHMWNKVKGNNRWYNLDLTFNNTLIKGNLPRHDYFLISDKSIQCDHKELSDSGIVCESYDLSYFNVKGLIMDTQQSFVNYLENAL